MWSDFVHIRHVFQSELTVWEKVNGFMFALSLSPNMLSAASAFALCGLYQMTVGFVLTHSRARRQGAEERGVLIDDDEATTVCDDEATTVCASMGTMAVIYVLFLLLIYGLPIFAIIFYATASSVRVSPYKRADFWCSDRHWEMRRELFSWVSCI